MKDVQGSGGSANININSGSGSSSGGSAGSVGGSSFTKYIVDRIQYYYGMFNGYLFVILMTKLRNKMGMIEWTLFDGYYTTEEISSPYNNGVIGYGKNLTHGGTNKEFGFDLHFPIICEGVYGLNYSIIPTLNI